MSMSEQLRILEPRLKELWGQLNNYVETENDKHFSVLLAQFGLAERTMESIRMTTDTRNLHECIDELRGNLNAHQKYGRWETVTQALDNLREAFELIQELRE